LQNAHDIVQEAIKNARFVCEEHYAMFRGPPVQLICPHNLSFAYVPGHLSHICFELLKSSLRAVVERFGVDNENHPPIKVVVVEGKEDITIKISDEGGGYKYNRYRELIIVPSYERITKMVRVCLRTTTDSTGR
jgi:pyruvate dehydrogenase kinase 2/3/4